LSIDGACRSSAEEANWRLIDTLWRVRIAAFGLAAKRVRGTRTKFRVRPSADYPRRVKPKGAASSRHAKHVFDRQGRSSGLKTQEPEPNRPA
jgi:hypothetical protein